MSDAISEPGSTMPSGAPDRECITILARDSAGAMAEFNRLGLGARGFAIAGQVMRHRFAFAGAADDTPTPFDGETLFAATYVRGT